MADKRGLVVILVIATVVLFVGAVWVIVTYLPQNLVAAPSPTITADAPRVAVNCAAPIVFWKQHPELFPAQAVIGGQVYKAGELAKIFSSQNGDLATKLQAQLTAVYLNILSGADQSYIETTIFEAYAWLVQHPAGSQVTDSEQGEGTRLFNLLEAYNLGLTGVKPCEIAGLILTEASTATETATVTASLTPSETGTLPPSETPVPTEITATDTYEFIPPTRAATRTNEPPIQYPTDTPVPPTQAPAPTNTAVPPNTPTFIPPQPTATLPPLPTATNTLAPPP